MASGQGHLPAAFQVNPANDLASQEKTGYGAKGHNPFEKSGRRGGIRTRDPLHPMQVRYQAALHADKRAIIAGYERAIDSISLISNSSFRICWIRRGSVSPNW